MQKSYKEMNYTELLKEEQRVKELLLMNRKPFTYKQNKKYLAKIQTELRTFERNYYGCK